MTNAIRSDIGQYCMVPLALTVSVSANAVRLYCLLAAKYADRVTGEATPKRKTMADLLGISVDTLDRAVKELMQAGWLEVDERFDDAGDRTSNLYTVRFLRLGSRTDAATGSPQPSGEGSRTDAVAVPVAINQESVSTTQVLLERDPMFLLYEENVGLLHPTACEHLRAWQERYPQEWVADALRMVRTQRPRAPLPWVEAVLTRWEHDGRNPAQDDSGTAREQFLRRARSARGA